MSDRERTEAESALEVVRDGLATLAQSMNYLCVSRTGLYALMATGALPYARFGTRRRIPWSALRAYAASRLVTGAGGASS
jgi:excisionase family DNA binding protein